MLCIMKNMLLIVLGIYNISTICNITNILRIVLTIYNSSTISNSDEHQCNNNTII